MDTEKLLSPVREAIELFSSAFHAETMYVSPLGAAWAPGRVNLIGEHTDYNGGFVLPLAMDRVTAFAGRTREDQLVHLWSEHFKEYAQFSLADLPASFEVQRRDIPGWARYILGVATELTRAGITLRGFDAVVSGDVPLGGGMSSSASLEVASAHAYALFSQHAFTIGEDDATLSHIQLAGICQRAEQIASGVMCGILDQAASSLGQPHKAILLDCRSLDYRYLPFEDPDVSIVVIDTGVRHELADSAYNERRQQCEEATRCMRELILQDQPDNEQAQAIKALCDITLDQFAHYKEQLPAILQKRAGYVIAENERVLQVVKLLETGDIVAAANILWIGHDGLKNEYEVSCVELDTLVDIAHDVSGVLGARMMGGGFGGCTINLVRNEAVDALRKAVDRYYPERTGRQASIDICRAAGGPGYTLLSPTF
jgi:galactokinase